MPVPIKYDAGYRVNFRYRNVRYRQRFPESRYADPEAAAQEYIASVLKPSAPAAAGAGRLADQIMEYHRWSELTRKKSASAMHSQQQMLRVFQEFARENRITSLAKIGPRQAIGFQEYYFANAPFYSKKHPDDARKSDHVATWEKYRQCLSAICNWGMRRDLTAVNPWNGPEMKMKSQKKPIRVMSPAEIEAIFNWIDRQDETYRRKVGSFFRIMLYTGMRPSEVLRLDWRSVNLDRRMISVEKSKNKEVRQVPISSRLLDLLELIGPARSGLVLATPYQKKRYWKELRRITDALDLGPIRVYDFRHTFAVRLYEKTRDLVMVQQLLGHTDIKMTRDYLVGFHPDTAAAVESLEF